MKQAILAILLAVWPVNVWAFEHIVISTKTPICVIYSWPEFCKKFEHCWRNATMTEWEQICKHCGKRRRKETKTEWSEE